MANVAQLFKTRIKGTGSYLPDKLLTNKDLEKMMDTSDEWITERTGIKARHIAADDQATSDLAVIAAQRALDNANVDVSEIDMILFATVTPDYLMPNTACMLQQKLGASNCVAMDLSAACSGLIYALSIADQFVKTGNKQNILVVGAEVLTRFIDYEDRTTCILFGDGASAVVVGRSEEDQDSDIYSHHLYAEGQLGDLLILHGGGSKNPPRQHTIDEKLHYVTMNGRDIFKNAVRTMGRCAIEAIEHNNMSPEDIDWMVPHQANIRIIEATAKQAKFPMEKVIVEIGDVGNTSAATVGIALDRAIQKGQIKRGQNVLLAAFGGGLTSGSLLMRY